MKITAVSCHPGGVAPQRDVISGWEGPTRPVDLCAKDTDLARWTISPEGDPQKATQLRKEGDVGRSIGSPWPGHSLGGCLGHLPHPYGAARGQHAGTSHAALSCS